VSTKAVDAKASHKRCLYREAHFDIVPSEDRVLANQPV